MERIALALAGAFSVAVLLVGSSASAQDERAQLHFRSGASYYEAGEYADALREFERAYALSERPALFYNFSLCYQSLNDLDNAVLYLGRYLSEVEDISNRANLELRLQNLTRRRDEAAARSQAQQPTQQQPTQQQPTQQQPAQQQPTQPQPAQQAAPQPPTDSSAPSSSTADGDATAGGGVPGAAIASFVVAGVGLAGMITFGAMALGEQSSVESGCFATHSCTQDDVSGMDTLALLSDIGLGVAVVGSALGLVFLLSSGDANTERASAANGLQIDPWLSDHGGGAVIRGAL